MKKLLFLFFISFSVISHAGILGGLILGSSIQSKKTIINNETDQQKLINILNKSIPLAMNEERNLYLNTDNISKISVDDDNWRFFNSPKLAFQIEGYDEKKIETYYKNLGYTVSIINHVLIFDFTLQHHIYIKHINTFSRSSKILLIFISLFFILLTLAIIRSYFDKQNIFKYMSNSHDLYFWQTNDKNQWLEALNTRKLPKNWVFSMDHDNKIISGIKYYNGKSLGNIASTGNPLPTWLSNKLLHTIKNQKP